MEYLEYIKLRNEFINKYNNSLKNELEFVTLSDIKVSSFDKFILLFSLDYLDVQFNNVNLDTKFNIHNKIVSRIKINSEYSMFDKYDFRFKQIYNYYFKKV